MTLAPLRRSSGAANLVHFFPVIFAMLCALPIAGPMFAQTQIGGSPIWYYGGNVGVGTNEPTSTFQVNVPGTWVPTTSNGLAGSGVVSSGPYGGGLGMVDGTYTLGMWSTWGNWSFGTGTTTTPLTSRMVITTNGNIGVGTTTPTSTFQVNVPGTWVPTTSNGLAGSGVVSSGPFGGGLGMVDGTYTLGMWSTWGNWNFGTGTTTTPLSAKMVVTTNGNVGIGTLDPCTNAQAPSNCKLSVAGAIQAYDVTVNNSWSDYVFDPDYRLAPLTEVADYIQQNHHLPDVPSALEVQQKGVSLGDMQAKLLAKIEELTLHMIRAEEENRELRERIARLEARGNQ